MARYTIICETDSCEYKLGFSMNYIPDMVENICEFCGAELKCVDYSAYKSAVNQSTGIINNRGEFHSRLGTEFRDFLGLIKKGSPNSPMKDYK